MKFLNKLLLILATSSLHPMEIEWSYPSDHLPIGIIAASPSFSSPMSLTSWNVLNSLWIDYIEKQTTNGIKDHLIYLHKTPHEGTPFTEREWSVNSIILAILESQASDGKLPFLMLQEVSKPMKGLIEEKLDSCYSVLETDQKYNDMGLMIYDKTMFQLEHYQAIHGIYSNDSDYYIQDALFRFEGTGIPFRIVNTHIPGGVGSKGIEEFAVYLKNTFSPTVLLFVAGDMNQDLPETLAALDIAFNGRSPFVNVDAYPTYLVNSGTFVSYDQIHSFVPDEADITIASEKL